MDSKDWILLFIVDKLGPWFTATEEDGDDKRPARHELACKAYGVAPPGLV